MNTTTTKPPTWVELKAVKPLKVAAEMLGTSVDTLEREYRGELVWISERCRGLRLEQILAIATAIGRRPNK